MQNVTIVVAATTPALPESFPDAVDTARHEGVNDELLMLADDNPLARHLFENLRAVLEAA